ncbi:MAG: YbaB/EbfC family nucleoid-associated protein, partial [Steroidobacteraceae bacterium]
VQLDQAQLSYDKDMLEDLVAAAINDSVHKIERATQEKMQSAMAGMQLPPGMKLPF